MVQEGDAAMGAAEVATAIVAGQLLFLHRIPML